jgi:hypothetical protein
MEAIPLRPPLAEASALPEPLPEPPSAPSTHKQGLRASRALLTGIARAVPASMRMTVFFMLIRNFDRSRKKVKVNSEILKRLIEGKRRKELNDGEVEPVN